MATYELQLVRVKVSDDEPIRITKPEQVVDYLQKNKCFTTEDFWREQCWMIALGKGNIPVGHFRVSSGSPSACLIDANLIARIAVMAGAVGVVVSHNHPSGDPTPSKQDYKATDRIYDAAQIMGIQLLDHVVIGDGKFESLFQNRKEVKHE